MLVLTRKEGEAIVFPELGIVVRVLDGDRHGGRLGIEAPKDVVVMREELLPKPSIDENGHR